MKHLSPEILLSIFKKLNSREMVKMIRVCKSWFQIIEANKTLWRRLVLPDDCGDWMSLIPSDGYKGWSPSIVKMFGEKSGNTLEEVEMNLDLLYDDWELTETFERSEQTLETVRLLLDHQLKNCTLIHCSWNFPHLVDFRFISRYVPRVCLSEKGIEDEDQGSRVHLSKLKVLWISYYEDSFVPHFQLLDNLSSLHIDDSIYSDQCRTILETPSRTLKHLDVKIYTGHNPRILDLPPLNFTQMQVLGIRADCFPSWMKIPASSTVIAQPYYRHESSGLYNSLPSVSTIWTATYAGIKGLSTRCPNLSTLRLDLEHLGEVRSTDREDLWQMLNDRRTNAEAQMIVDGVEMVAIKTLIVPFADYSPHGPHGMLQLRSVVEEVIYGDLYGDEMPRLIEVEI